MTATTTTPDTPPTVVVDESQALFGGLPGQGKSAAVRQAVAEVLARGRAAGVLVVLTAKNTPSRTQGAASTPPRTVAAPCNPARCNGHEVTP
ncbi:hypothetical protein [Nonomuraea sp. NPDC049158]|uniref:hypothetical protein n=1 Tax=Nonomuraea sp. NPDC049158 TaxID=3155649 RepID=UPI003411943D